MLKDKRTELDAERRKRLLDRLISDMSQQDPDLYYRSTSQIAAMIMGYVKSGENLNGEERDLLRPLSQRDIEVLLSLKS